jgi:hypothetical protein
MGMRSGLENVDERKENTRSGVAILRLQENGARRLVTQALEQEPAVVSRSAHNQSVRRNQKSRSSHGAFQHGACAHEGTELLGPVCADTFLNELFQSHSLSSC